MIRASRTTFRAILVGAFLACVFASAPDPS
jgi:hypothetical protein